MRAVELQFQVLEDVSQDQRHGVDRELVAHAGPAAGAERHEGGLAPASVPGSGKDRISPARSSTSDDDVRPQDDYFEKHLQSLRL